MEIWGELSLPSDPLALSDSNLFERIDDSEHDQYEDDPDLDEQRLHAHDLDSYVCNAAKALESVLSEALGKYPLVVLDEQTKSKGSMKLNRNQKLARGKSGKCRNTISASLFGDSLESYDDANDLLEIWEETELDEEISSIEEEIERIQQQKYEIESTVPYSPRIESHDNNTLFFEEYTGFLLEDPEDIADNSDCSSSLSSPLPSPLPSPTLPQSPLLPSTPLSHEQDDSNTHVDISSAEEDETATCPSDCLPSSPSTNTVTSATAATEQSKSTRKRSTTETDKPQLREKRRRNTKNCLSKSIAIEASLSVTVIENSSESPSGKTWAPTRRRKSKKRMTPKKKKMEEIFKSEEVLKIKAVEEDEVDVAVDVGDASDFTNY
jgi:hypothetical protein